VSSSTPCLLSIDPSNLPLPAPFSRFAPYPDLHKNAEEERERRQGLESGSTSGKEDSAAGAALEDQGMEDFEAQAEDHWSKKQEPKARTKSGNKPRTILKHAEKIALIAMSEADKTSTQEQIAAKFE
jgi:hypothetical protein